eukprot:12816006-Alexandrium_andersonii.AAC.1
MSASLVGSEMCIRDRPWSRCRAAQARSMTATRRGPRRAARASGRAAPVSYTHLTLPTICSV